MNLFRRLVLLLSVLILAGTASGADSGADSTPLPRKKILFFSKSSGFEHEAIKLTMKDGRPGYAFAVIRDLAAQNNLDVTFSKDGSLFTPEYLAQFDAFAFFSTGDLTLAKNTERSGDGNPPMTAAGKAAPLAAIENGKGFVGVHTATDTFHSPGNRDDRTPERYISDGDKTDVFIKMVGGEFVAHEAEQPAHQIVADPKFSGMSAVPADFGPVEEWYSLKNFAPDLHVLIIQDTTGMRGAAYQRPPYPTTWARMHGRGRVFNTSMGHREDVWTNPVFQAVLLGGINWATGRIAADVTPNLNQVTPQAGVMPLFVPPKPAAPTFKSTP